ncbi:MAG TPA: succinylglutamate desuccinylase/aspartoacylase family protein, partial [Thermomicrobiaceae bacterium]|nr:succinylglutamate desuccinylase/aspartoacylase family protein [Thermomicrobiaceae bacterium]
MSNPVIPATGERQEGELTSDLPILSGWSWPYVAISGRRDGPRVTIIAGIHGCEYVSIRAAVRLAHELDPSELIGQAVIVPIVSLPMFWERTPFVNPFDGKNPNRVFPGKATGTFAEAMAYFIFESCIKPSDAFIDLHGGDMVEELAPFAGYAANAEPSVAARSKAMAEAFGLDFLIPHRREFGSPPGFTHLSAAQQGIAAVLDE